MAFGAARRECLWFGTVERAGWFQTPNSGAPTSPAGWNASGTTLNGGGYSFSSWNSHKEYIFDWPQVAPETAQKMMSYASGSYGRGLLYFVLPNTYRTNIFPAQWADPSIGIGFTGGSLVYGVEPTGVPVAANVNGTPVRAATYNLNATSSGFRGTAEAVFLPIPEGHTLYLGASYTSVGSAGVYASPQLTTGGIGVPQSVTPLPVAGTNVVQNSFSNIPGVWVWVGKTASGNASITLQAMSARLLPSAKAANPNEVALLSRGPWVGGQGHSGCAFNGKPTYIEHHPGRVSFSASFIETGSWANG